VGFGAGILKAFSDWVSVRLAAQQWICISVALRYKRVDCAHIRGLPFQMTSNPRQYEVQSATVFRQTWIMQVSDFNR
jgi:hypothetical protein